MTGFQFPCHPPTGPFEQPPFLRLPPPTQAPPVIYWPHVLATRPITLQSEIDQASASMKDVLLTFAARMSTVAPPRSTQTAQTQTVCKLSQQSAGSQTQEPRLQQPASMHHKFTHTTADLQVGGVVRHAHTQTQAAKGGSAAKTHYTQTPESFLSESRELEQTRREVVRLQSLVEEIARERASLADQLAEEKRLMCKAGNGDDFLLVEYQNQVAAHEQEARVMRKEIAQLKEQAKFLKLATDDAQRQTELVKNHLDRLELEKSDLTRKFLDAERRALQVVPKKLDPQPDLSLSDFSSAPDDIHVQRAHIKNRRR